MPRGNNMKNFNRQIRDIISSWVEDGAMHGFNITDSLSLHIPQIYEMLNNSSIEQNMLGNLLVSTGFLDAYKMCSNKEKNCINEDLEEDTLGNLFDISDYNDLLEQVQNDPNFLLSLLKQSYYFNNLGSLGKIYLLKSLSERENDWLSTIIPIHKQDLDTYNIEVSLANLIKYWKGKEIYQNKVMIIDFKEAIVMNIVGFIHNLSVVDFNNAANLVLDIAKIDYATSKYLVNKKGISDEEILDHIIFYEDYSLDEILAELLTNQDFLQDAIWMMSGVYIYNKYDSILLSEDMIASTDKEKMDKKLVLN